MSRKRQTYLTEEKFDVKIDALEKLSPKLHDAVTDRLEELVFTIPETFKGVAASLVRDHESNIDRFFKVLYTKERTMDKTVWYKDFIFIEQDDFLDYILEKKAFLYQ